MNFIDILNESAVTYVRDLGIWGWGPIPGKTMIRLLDVNSLAPSEWVEFE